jgi:hypothetical protein
MPSDPHSFYELKLPFIFVPHGAPEPTEWMIIHLDWIKLSATLEPDAQRDGRAKRSSGSLPPGQRRSLDRPAASPGPAAPSPSTADSTSSRAPAATNQTADQALFADDPIAAFRGANDALATTTSDHASGRAAGPNPPPFVQNELVPLHSDYDSLAVSGQVRASLCRAFCVVNFHLIRAPDSLRCRCHASISETRTSRSPIRRSRH